VETVSSHLPPSQHLPEGYPRDFPLPTACTSLFSVCVAYVGHETTVQLHIEPFTVQVASMVSRTCHSILCIVHSHTAIAGLNSLLHFIPPTVHSPFLLLGEILPLSWGTWPVVGSTSTAMGSQSSCAKREWSMLGSCNCWSRGSQELSPLNRYNRIHDG